MKALLHTTYPRQLLGQLHPENNSKPWVLCAENQTMPKKLIEQIFQKEKNYAATSTFTYTLRY